jgi:choline dehydrogenase
MSLKDQLLASLEASLITGRIDRRSFMRFMGAAGLFGTGVTALADTLDAIRSNQEARGKNLLDAYDYIVCGTGSAGCALVHRPPRTRTRRSW